MVSRIKQLLEWQQLSPTQFADRIGVGRPVVSHILSERNKPSLEVARSIKAAFPELSLDWLLNGSGEMLIKTPDVPTQLPFAAVAPVVSAGLEAPRAAAAPATASIAHPNATQKVSEGQFPPAPADSSAAPGRFTAANGVAPALPPARVAAKRFVAAGAKTIPAQEPSAPVAATSSAPSSDTPATARTTEFAVPRAPAAPTPATPEPAGMTDLTQALLGGVAAPGKAIRRIVIFYSDGSFADYKPESQA